MSADDTPDTAPPDDDLPGWLQYLDKIIERLDEGYGDATKEPAKGMD